MIFQDPSWKEEIGENGLAELYEVALQNVVSHCSGHLAEASKNHGINLPEEDSLFTQFFRSKISMIFYYSERDIQTNKLDSEVDFADEKDMLYHYLVRHKDLILRKNEENVDDLPF